MFYDIFCHLYSSSKNKYAANRAENAVSLIKANMEISDSDLFSLYNKYASNTLKIRGKNLTDEEKKQVYRSFFKDTRKKLMEVLQMTR